MPRRARPGILCLEGGWSSSLAARESVEPLMMYLERVGQIRYIHQRARTLEAALEVLQKWPQHQYRTYSLGYLGFHGSAGALDFGHRKLTLDALGRHLAGKCSGKTLYFGSCSVLDVPKRKIEAFRGIVRARCVAGYTRHIDWYESAAFDLLLFEALTRYQRIDAVDNWLRRQYPGLVRQLGFKMFYG